MIVTSESIGLSIEACIVNGKAYTIMKPNTLTLEKVGECLGELGDGIDASVVIGTIEKERRADALSLLVRGDNGLSEELLNGTDEELTEGIIKGLSFIHVHTAGRMGAIVKNISNLIARSR